MILSCPVYDGLENVSGGKAVSGFQLSVGLFRDDSSSRRKSFFPEGRTDMKSIDDDDDNDGRGNDTG
jgi:hypothetical protein